MVRLHHATSVMVGTARPTGRWLLGDSTRLGGASMTPINLSAIEARLKAATPGPWKSEPCSAGGRILVRGPEQPLSARHEQQFLQVCPEVDAHLVAHAPSDLAALLQLVRELQRRICPDVHRVLNGQCENCLAQFTEGE